MAPSRGILNKGAPEKVPRFQTMFHQPAPPNPWGCKTMLGLWCSIRLEQRLQELADEAALAREADHPRLPGITTEEAGVNAGA